MCLNSISVAVAGWPAKKTNPGHWRGLDSPHHSQTVSGKSLCVVSCQIIPTSLQKMSVFHFFGLQVGDATGL